MDPRDLRVGRLFDFQGIMRYSQLHWVMAGLLVLGLSVVFAEDPPGVLLLTSNEIQMENIEVSQQPEPFIRASSYLAKTRWAIPGLGLIVILLGLLLLKRHTEIKKWQDLIHHQKEKLEELARQLEASQAQLTQSNIHSAEKVQSRLREMQYANQKLEQYALRVATELKQPIRTTTGFIQVLDRELKKENPSNDRLQECLRFSEEGLRHIRQVTERILRLSRYSHHSEMFVHEIDLRKLCNQIRKSLQPQVVKKGIRLKIRVPQLFLVGNSLRLEQLIQSLSEFLVIGDSAGSVITLGASDMGETVELIIQSDAADVTGEKLRILNKVFKKSTAPLTDDPWSLTLRMCRKITKLHHGRLIVAGGRHEGIAFTLHLKKAFASADTNKAALPNEYRS